MMLQQMVMREVWSLCLIKLRNSVEVLERWKTSINLNEQFSMRY